MYRDDPCVVLTREGAGRIARSNATGGRVIMRHAPSETMYVVAAIEIKEGLRVPIDIPREYVALNWGDPLHQAQWMRTPTASLNVEHLMLLRRPGTIFDFDRFRELVPAVRDPGNISGLLLTHDPDLSTEALEAGAAEFAGWLIERGGVRPIHIEVEPRTIGIEQLRGTWPIDELAENSVMLVGCGSIGSAAAEALAGYGVGRVELVDPDRFWWHNMLRHCLGRESVGRLKVDALKDYLKRRWPNQVFGAHARDVVTEAHHTRALVQSVDLVVCAADGIAPRRVVSHIARRSGCTAVLACVLDHGALGEVLRLRPTPRFGCLLCLRQLLASQGAMDVEADQELRYGTGMVHQAMTAAPPDLRYVGTFAAKVAVATLLESLHGDHTQRLPGELAILGLRPSGDLASPFDLREAGDMTWTSIPPPRTTCPTCTTA